MIGKEIANYRIVEKLGEGGMGVVYKAVDLNLDRPVAIKILNSDLARNPDLVERFKAEARAQANLNHTNLATLYSFLVSEGSAMMVMEFVDGETLEQMVRRKGPIPSPEAIPLFQQALQGIGFAHRHGIIHRDIKPSNLMLSRDGVVKVMDFGIAKVMGGRGLTRTGTQLGTACYMAPEQVLNKPVDIRSDIYALGVTLFELLSGHVPFEAESDYQTMSAHVNTPPPLPTRFFPYIPKGVEAAVLKALEKNPDQRFQTVEGFAAALEHPENFVAASTAVTVSLQTPAGKTRLEPATLPGVGLSTPGQTAAAPALQVQAPAPPGPLAAQRALIAVGAVVAAALLAAAVIVLRHQGRPTPASVRPPTAPPTTSPGPSPSAGAAPRPASEAAPQGQANVGSKAQAVTAQSREKQASPRISTPAERTKAEPQPAIAPAQPAQWTIPAGTAVYIRMIDGVDPQRDQPGKEFAASLYSPVMAGNKEAIPKGAEARVKLVAVPGGGNAAGGSSLALQLVRVAVSGRNYAVSSNSWAEHSAFRSQRGGVAGVAGTVGGAIGGLFGRKKKREAAHEEAKVAPETEIQFLLAKPLTVSQTP